MKTTINVNFKVSGGYLSFKKEMDFPQIISDASVMFFNKDEDRRCHCTPTDEVFYEVRGSNVEVLVYFSIIGDSREERVAGARVLCELGWEVSYWTYTEEGERVYMPAPQEEVEHLLDRYFEFGDE